jgi:O-antigen/teichoic acid export membrane protein
VYYFHQRSSPDRNKVLTLQTAAMLVVSGALTALLLVFGAPAIAALMKNRALAPLLVYYGAAIGFLIASEHFVQLMIAHDRYQVAVLVETVETVVRVVVLIAPLLAGYGLTGIVIAALGYAMLRFAVRSVWLIAPLGSLARPPGQHWFTGEQLAYSVPLGLMSLVGVVGSQLDRAIIATVFTPADYAIYSVGALEIPLDAIFQASVATVLRASMPGLIREGRHDEVVRLLREGVRKLSLIVLPCFVFLLAYAHEFITVLFTQQYAPSVNVFRIYVFLMPLNMFILSPVPPAYGRTTINFYIVACVTAVHAVLSFVLLRWIGFYGPAVSTIVTAYLISTVYFVFARRLTGGTVATLLPLETFAKVLAVSAVAVGASKMLLGTVAQSLAGLVASGALFGAAFLVICTLTGVFTAADRQLARRWLERLTGAR